MGYARRGDAIRVFRRMERCDLCYFEQPVEGIARLAQVARAIDVPVMADESAWNAHDVIETSNSARRRSCRSTPPRPGGLYRAMEAAAVARAGAGIVCNVNGSVETGVGNLANLALAAAAPAVVLSCVVPVSTPAEAQTGQIAGIYYKDDLIAEADAPRRWGNRVPTGNGMGIASTRLRLPAIASARRSRVTMMSSNDCGPTLRLCPRRRGPRAHNVCVCK